MGVVGQAGRGQSGNLVGRGAPLRVNRVGLLASLRTCVGEGAAGRSVGAGVGAIIDVDRVGLGLQAEWVAGVGQRDRAVGRHGQGQSRRRGGGSAGRNGSQHPKTRIWPVNGMNDVTLRRGRYMAAVRAALRGASRAVGEGVVEAMKLVQLPSR